MLSLIKFVKQQTTVAKFNTIVNLKYMYLELQTLETLATQQ